MKEYIQIKKVTLIPYSINKNDIKLFFYKNKNENFISLFTNEVTLIDNSPIFSMARLMVNKFYQILSDEVLNKFNSTNLIEEKYLNLPKNELVFPDIWDDNIMIYWLNKISDNIIQYDDIENEKIYFIEIPYIKNLDSFNNLLSKHNFSFLYSNESKINEIKLNSENEYIQKLLPKFFSHIKETKELIKNNKREKYIFLLCKKRGKGELGYFHFSSLFNGLYRTNKEEFIIMLASKELPNEKLLSESKCLIIPGSDLSVHNKLDFLRETEKFLKELIEDMLLKGKYPNLKILGICFGLEIIVSAFKGEIIKQPWSSEACYDIEKIFINKDFFNLDFVKKSKIEKTNFLYINEAHSESISKLPKFPKLNIFGYSNSCKYEVLVDDNEKIFLIQGHPEYSPGLYLCKDIDYFMKINKIEYNDKNKKKFLNYYLNEEKRKKANFISWRKLCWAFMKEH